MLSAPAARFAPIALAACAVLACAVPALAVDRSLGADVPRPAATGAPWTAAEIASLAARADGALASGTALRGAHAGLLVVDARDGRVLYQRDADGAFQPASALKLLVGSAALDELGPSFRFVTNLVADGAVSAGGVLQGRLVLSAGGDPLLSAANLDAAADAVAKAGIVRVAGGVAVDDARYEPPGYPPGWSVDDLPYDYAPVVGALALESNTVHLTVAPGASPGDPARVTAAPVGVVDAAAAGCAPTAQVRVLASAVTGAAGVKSTVDLARERAGCIRVTGTIAAGAKPDALDAAVPSPAVYAHDVLAAALARHGVAVDEPPPPPGPWPFEYRAAAPPPPLARTLWSHASEPLGDVVADMWLPSDNLAAELLLRELGAADAGAPGTAAHGLAFERRWLANLGVAAGAADLQDGSGLSVYDRITPRALVAILRHDWDGPNRALVLDDLPVAAVRGTLRRSYAGTPAAKRVFAKTGTLSHVSTLAGYAANAKHGAVIFAFLVDDWVGPDAALRDVRGRVLSLLVQS